MLEREALETREALPEALRVLLADYPREAWEANSNFSDLIRFWLDRHIMFRRLVDTMQRETEGALDKNVDLAVFASHLSRYGGMFLNELHMHHTIEDTHYFPKLKQLDRRISRGFDILDLDHKAIDGHLETFAGAANAVLQDVQTAPDTNSLLGPFHHRLTRTKSFLNRHLEDEEELVVPVLLAHAPEGLV